MFSNISSIADVISLIIIMALVVLLIIEFVRVRILKKGKDSEIANVIETLQKIVIDAMSNSDELEIAEKTGGRAKVIEVLVVKLKLAIQKTTLINNAYKMILLSMDLTRVAELLLQQVIALKIFKEEGSEPTPADKLIDKIEDTASDIASGGQKAEEAIEELIDDTAEQLGIPDKVADSVINPVVETIVTEDTITPIDKIEIKNDEMKIVEK